MLALKGWASIAVVCTCAVHVGESHAQQPVAGADDEAWLDTGDPDEPDMEDPEVNPDRSRFSAKLSFGPTLRGLSDLPLAGIEVEVALGGKLSGRNLFVYGTMGYLRAETLGGLEVHRPVAGALFEWSDERWRAGLAPQLSLALIRRITTGALMYSAGIGGEIQGSVDLYRGDWGDGLFLGLSAGVAAQIPTLYYGSTLRLGYRL